jgi:hypothetical protein
MVFLVPSKERQERLQVAPGKAYGILNFTYKKRIKKVSEKELANRNKFAMAQAWLKPLLQRRKGRTADRIVLTTIENI